MNCDSSELVQLSEEMISVASPSSARVSRSISTSYYAMFHHVCGAACDLFLGTQDEENQLSRARSHLSRSIDHKILVRRLGLAQNADYEFPEPIVSFCNILCTSYKNRITADYDRNRDFSKSDAVKSCLDAKCAMENFDAVEEKHRRAFLMWALIEKPSR